jgi:hypothetical protein
MAVWSVQFRASKIQADDSMVGAIDFQSIDLNKSQSVKMIAAEACFNASAVEDAVDN